MIAAFRRPSTRAPPHAIGLAIFDAKGAPIASRTIPVDPGSVTDALALLAAKDASSILVAWSEQAPAAPARVRLARFGCLDGG